MDFKYAIKFTTYKNFVEVTVNAATYVQNWLGQNGLNVPPIPNINTDSVNCPRNSLFFFGQRKSVISTIMELREEIMDRLADLTGQTEKYTARFTSLVQDFTIEQVFVLLDRMREDKELSGKIQLRVDQYANEIRHLISAHWETRL